MKKTSWLIALCVFWLSPQAFADYYLKFETSGVAYDGAQTFPNNGGAWLKVSIVDSYPTGAKVHFPGSQIEAWPGFIGLGSPYPQKTVGVNHTEIYYSDVPRTVTIQTVSTGAKETLKFGDPAKDYTGAPSILLPDGLVVAPGLDVNSQTGNHSIYIAAAMPIREVVTNRGDTSDPVNYPGGGVSYLYKCNQGWYTSGIDANAIEMRHALAQWNGHRCSSVLAYGGYLSQRIIFE